LQKSNRIAATNPFRLYFIKPEAKPEAILIWGEVCNLPISHKIQANFTRVAKEKAGNHFSDFPAHFSSKILPA
jgi:hypothetical protein